jgi:hypothetical protein
MFDSVRTRLTLWYIGVLALVIVAFALLTYFFTVRVLNQDVNMRLEEMSRNFTVALEAEESDEEEESRNTEQIITETTNEFRFRDYHFAVFADNGHLIASTADFSIQENGVGQTPTFRELTYGNEKFRVYDSPLEIRQNRYRLLVFHSLREQITFENRLMKIFSSAFR